MTEARISQIAKGKNLNNLSESTINTTTPAAEIESLQRKLEEAEAARRSTEQRLSAVQSVPSSRFGSPKLASPRRLKVEHSGADVHASLASLHCTHCDCSVSREERKSSLSGSCGMLLSRGNILQRYINESSNDAQRKLI